MKYYFVRKSENSKTGPIPITYTEENSCPDNCPLKSKDNKSGCYAKAGFYTQRVWINLLKETGYNIEEFGQKIMALPKNQIWRHNVGGDLPGENNEINLS